MAPQDVVMVSADLSQALFTRMELLTLSKAACGSKMFHNAARRAGIEALRCDMIQLMMCACIEPDVMRSETDNMTVTHILTHRRCSLPHYLYVMNAQKKGDLRYYELVYGI